MTRHAPWEIDGKDPGVRTNRPILCLAIDTDCALQRYESSDLQALKDLFTDQYSQWKDVVTLRRPLIYNTPYDVVDELLPKQKQRPLNFKNLLCVAWKPTVSAAGFDVAPDNARERRSDRFDQDAFHPAAEGNLTRWRFVSMLAMPELTCPRFRKIFPEGMLICLACGLSMAIMSDMRRPARSSDSRSWQRSLASTSPWTCWEMTMLQARRKDLNRSGLLQQS